MGAKREIIIDTSAMLFGLANRKDAFRSAEEQYPDCVALVSRGVIRELEGLSSGRGRKAGDARTALLILKSRRVKIDKDTGMVDDWIFARATGTGAMVCTNDSELARKLCREGIGVVRMGRDGRLR